MRNNIKHTLLSQLSVNRFLRLLMFVMCVAAAGKDSQVWSQSLRDTIIELDEVQVRARHIFEKETAGMKQTEVDSLVISQKLHMSLADLLSENTPVYIKSHGRGALATASFRGTAPSHTRVNWNGISINSPMLGMVDFSLLPLSIIDDITLKHGNASVMDQSGGLGGSINITNRADWQSTRQLSFTQSVGSFSTYDQILKASLGNRQIQWRSHMYYNRSENDYTFINRAIARMEDGEITHPLDTNKHADYSRYGTLQELYWQPSSRHMFSFHWWGQWAERGIPRVISFEGAENANVSNQQEDDHKAVARWRWYGENGNLTIRSGFASKQLDYSLTNQISGSDPLPAIHSVSNQQSFMQHAGYQRELSPRLSLQASVDMNHHMVDTHDSVSNTGYDIRRRDLSSLLALQAGVHERANVHVMVRQDLTDGSLSPIIPFVGMDFLLSDDIPLVFKANVARNYRNPSLNDLYWQPGGNPELKPEEGFSLEGGIEGDFVIDDARVNSEITFYRSDINDWILWAPSFKGYWEPQNIKRVLSQGVEAHSSVSGYAGRINYRLAGTYTFTRALNYGDPLVWGDDSHGKQLVFTPVHSGNLMVTLQHKGISLTWQYNSHSEQHTTSSNDLNSRNWLYPYHMNDLSMSKRWQFNQWNAEVAFKAYNLFNETYHTILLRPMPGRNYMISVKAGIRR